MLSVHSPAEAGEEEAEDEDGVGEHVFEEVGVIDGSESSGDDGGEHLLALFDPFGIGGRLWGEVRQREKLDGLRFGARLKGPFDDGTLVEERAFGEAVDRIIAPDEPFDFDS